MKVKFSFILIAGGLLLAGSFGLVSGSSQVAMADRSIGTMDSGTDIAGPFIDSAETYPHEPAVFDGNLLEQAANSEGERDPQAPVIQPLRSLPGQSPKTPATQNEAWIDPVIQKESGSGIMPDLMPGFRGLNFSVDGSGWPPDTNGDVGPNHYIQMVNTSIGIFDRATGSLLYRARLNDFFSGPINTPCDNNNRGDPIVVYDGFEDRWVVTNFAWIDPSGPFYECIAVSQSGDPVSGGWYFYALRADTGNFEFYVNDYPKLGVWHDGWYMTANMFERVYPYRFGVRVWALDRQKMIQGLPLQEVHFDLCTQNDCGSLLPAHDNLAQAGGVTSPANYLVSARMPDQLLLWRFRLNFSDPLSSSLTGPTVIQTAPFAIAASIEQPEQVGVLDSLSYRLMMQLQYRLFEGVESLWLNHTVASSGLAAVRWYEIRNPADSVPVLAQQGTYQPESAEAGLQRWMASLAVDMDGNMALGYSAASTQVYPSIRMAGRLRPETVGQLPQAEIEVRRGSGSQVYLSRWGDYTAMTVAPDGCTFYYTNEYYLATGTNWQTWIVPFRFPSCGSAKGELQGIVLNASTGQPIPDTSVIVASAVQIVTVSTNPDGQFSLSLAEGVYSVTAGPILPGFPEAATIHDVEITAGTTQTAKLLLTPYPFLSIAGTSFVDTGPQANGNGIPEPGENDLALWIGLKNEGAAAASSIVSRLDSPTAGVQFGENSSLYTDIQPGEVVTQTIPYTFSLSQNMLCGSQLDFTQVVTDTLQTTQHGLSFDTSLNQDRQTLFSNDVEQGSLLWHTEGTNNSWAITEVDGSYSPTHAWSDRPTYNYLNNTNSSLVTTPYNLAGKRNVRVEFAIRYSLETGWDYLYIEYSLDGGETWEAEPLESFTGFSPGWLVKAVDASILDGQPEAALRFRLLSDMSVVYSGVVLDDLSITFEPYTCQYPVAVPPEAPVPLHPMAGELYHLIDLSAVKFNWLPSPSGAAVDGYRLFVDGVQVGDLAGSETEMQLPVMGGEHSWTIHAYNGLGNSPDAALTFFTTPFIKILPLVYNQK